MKKEKERDRKRKEEGSGRERRREEEKGADSPVRINPCSVESILHQVL